MLAVCTTLLPKTCLAANINAQITEIILASVNIPRLILFAERILIMRRWAVQCYTGFN